MVPILDIKKHAVCVLEKMWIEFLEFIKKLSVVHYLKNCLENFSIFKMFWYIEIFNFPKWKN